MSGNLHLYKINIIKLTKRKGTLSKLNILEDHSGRALTEHNVGPFLETAHETATDHEEAFVVCCQRVRPQ